MKQTKNPNIFICVCLGFQLLWWTINTLREKYSILSHSLECIMVGGSRRWVLKELVTWHSESESRVVNEYYCSNLSLHFCSSGCQPRGVVLPTVDSIPNSVIIIKIIPPPGKPRCQSSIWFYNLLIWQLLLTNRVVKTFHVPEAVHNRRSYWRNDHRQHFLNALCQLRNLKPGIDKQEFMK